ncbi:Chaperone binding,ATPase activator [Micractinium conductrix]|uniref:Chaperone binding,ATPase activator n=1 Tax=Micractinium conductrix TaxID=554055 RepID=A0A2P6V7T1_9CHLO|nr:Chaperone binding,ATPase activator [Micractinium conductrix]|eukprot:PSC70145.1 Chaperone binding,ATPase activator [Micractinium conductrix]
MSDKQRGAPSSKLEEQATGKADLSYSYWAANAASEAPPPQPKKLSEAEAAAHQQQLLHTAGGASAWNAAGTWEERPVALAWVQQQLGELLAALHHSARGVAVAVAEVTSCSGEAHQWVVRGKRRAGFELAVEFKWRAELGGGAAVTGTAKIPHAAADELDEMQLEVTADAAAAAADAGADGGGEPPSAQQRDTAAAAVRELQGKLEGVMEQLLERIRHK